MLSSAKYLTHVQHARTRGFFVGLIYVALPNVETSIARVAIRVRKGGHDVPADKQRARWNRSLDNLVAYAPLVDRLLMHKLPVEIDAIRRAARIADDAYTVFREAVRPGRAQYELVADVEAYLRSRGCPDNFMILGSGGKDVLGMTPPSDRRIAAGDLVTTELTPCVEGYYVQICRTVVVGKASDAQRRAFGVYREALEAGIAAVKPGVTAADVARAENDIFRKYGLGDYVTSKWTRVRGHGLGLFCDSKPHILEDVDTPLLPGMALIVHPNTYHPEVGYLVLGDAVVVTDEGAEVLCKTPRELFEVPE